MLTYKANAEIIPFHKVPPQPEATSHAVTYGDPVNFGKAQSAATPARVAIASLNPKGIQAESCTVFATLKSVTNLIALSTCQIASFSIGKPHS